MGNMGLGEGTGMLLDRDGYHTKCDWCGKIKILPQDHGGRCECPECVEWLRAHDMIDDWRIFFRLPSGKKRGVALPHDFPSDLCLSCVKILTPWVAKFADIALVNYFNNNLQRAIYDKRKETRRTEDYGPASDYACECCQRRHARAA